MQTLTVDLGERSYPIHIGGNLLTDASLLLKLLQPHIRGSQVMLVSNDVVAPIYLEKLKQGLQGYLVDQVILPDGESYKNLDTLNLIFDQLLQSKHNRTTTLIALGGGVAGDMTGFAAACYQRGVNFIQVPTTLLAQVDSSVGGKTGVNHALGKNMIGAFHQPQCVLIDTDTLSTLPEREFLAGFAEVIKYGLICDRDFYQWLQTNAEKVLQRNTEALVYIISRSCQNKADVVAEDERESGIRAILNLGHTFGHAIETFTRYQSFLHGEAIAVGMVMAADLSARMDLISAQEALNVKTLIESAGLPVCPPSEMSIDDFVQLMAVDKKVLDGNLRLVLLQKIGKAFTTSDIPRDLLEQTLCAGNALCQL